MQILNVAMENAPDGYVQILEGLDAIANKSAEEGYQLLNSVLKKVEPNIKIVQAIMSTNLGHSAHVNYKNPAAQLGKAQILCLRQDFKKAKLLLTELSLLDETKLDALKYLALLEYYNDHDQDAQLYIDKYLELMPIDCMAYRLQISIADNLHDFHKVIRAAKIILAYNPSDAGVQFSLMRAYNNIGSYQLLLDLPEIDHDYYKYLKAIALSHLNKNDLAIEMFNAIKPSVENFPESYFAHDEIFCYLKDQELEQNDKKSLLFIVQNRKNHTLANYLNSKAWCLNQYKIQVRHLEALELLKQAQKLDRSNSEIKYNLGVTFCYLNQFKDAITYFNQIKTNDLEDSFFFKVQAYAHFVIGSQNKPMRLWQSAINQELTREAFEVEVKEFGKIFHVQQLPLEIDYQKCLHWLNCARFDLANNYLLKVRAIDENYKLINFLAGVVAYSKSDYDAAHQSFLKALASLLNPEQIAIITRWRDISAQKIADFKQDVIMLQSSQEILQMRPSSLNFLPLYIKNNLGRLSIPNHLEPIVDAADQDMVDVPDELQEPEFDASNSKLDSVIISPTTMQPRVAAIAPAVLNLPQQADNGFDILLQASKQAI